MNNEIKEILDKLNNPLCSGMKRILTDYETNLLLDYITNLQENYERIYNEHCELREQHNITDISLLDDNYKLQQENEMLTKIVVDKDGKIKELQQENEDLKVSLSGSTFCYDEEEHKRLQHENEILKARQDIGKTCGLCPYYHYKSRNEKAIEYIDQVLQYHLQDYKQADEDCNTLIGILRGDGKGWK